MIKFSDLTAVNAPSNRMILENDTFDLIAYVRVIKDVNGTLWHDLSEWVDLEALISSSSF
jgi:hypothetical protein